MARRTHAEVVAEIRAFDPAEQVGWVNNWGELESLLAELSKFGRPLDAIPILIEVYERFPTADGHTLWGVMHGLESLAGYEPHLARSVARMPSIFGARMLGRMLNGGITNIDGEPIYQMLQAVANNSELPDVIREEATGFMARHPHLHPPSVTHRKRRK